MARRYRNIFHRQVEGLDPGAEGELDLDPEREGELLTLGRLEVLPVDYQVIGNHAVFDTAPGMTLTHAMPLAQERLLVGAGHLELVPARPRRKADRGE